MRLYRENEFTPDSYVIVNESGGSASEISEMESGLYRYTLTTPVQVEADYVLGVSYQITDTNLPIFPIGFRDAGTGSNNNPVSYRRPSPGSFIFDTSASFVVEDNQFLPLISVIIGKLS